MTLEILHLALVLFGRGTRFECAEIAALTRFRIEFARLQAVLAAGEFVDHA